MQLPGDITVLEEDHKKKLCALGIPVQPHIIVQGTRTTIDQVYVCINDKLYLVPTILRGIEACFHAYHVFNLKYQFQSEHMWNFLQHAIYDFKSKYDVPIPSILDIANKVKQLTKQ